MSMPIESLCETGLFVIYFATCPDSERFPDCLFRDSLIAHALCCAQNIFLLDSTRAGTFRRKRDWKGAAIGESLPASGSDLAPHQHFRI